MTPSTVASDHPDDDLSTQNPSPFKYDLRLEIGVKDEGTTVPVVAIFYDFVKHLKQAADHESPVAVLTATDKLFFENNDMPSDEFRTAFKVVDVEGKTPKVLLGFKIHTLTKLSELKRRMMHSYLIPRHLFLYRHAGGFDQGVKTFSYGFVKEDHPDHPDISILKQSYARITKEAWRTLDKDDRQKWRQEFPNLFYGDTGIIIPVNFSKERITAAIQGKDRVITSALIVTTPSKYGKLLKILLDIALSTKRLNNLIPFALNRENSDGYYYMVAHQARFMETHRNIPIANVPPDANTYRGHHGPTLLEVLTGHTAVKRVAYDPQTQKYHVSTTASKYREIHQWITKALADHRFPYSPQIRPMRYGSGASSTTGFSYSDIFKDAMSQASDNFATEDIPAPPNNPWKTRPPLAISYDINDTAFPALTRPKNNTPSTPSTASETIDEETIQSAISIAIKTLEDQYKAELAQLKLDVQSKIDEVSTQMKELGQQVISQTYQALVHEESPLATKMDHAILQHDISVMRTQLTALMEMMQNACIVPTPSLAPDHSAPSTPPRSIVMKQKPTTRSVKRKPTSTPEKERSQTDFLTQENSVSSATSSSAESMEGCED